MASKPDIWMPLYIGDYLAATAHLDALESGAYLHLLMHQWKNEKLPAESEGLRRIAKVDKDAWSNAWLLLSPFFDYSKGFPVQLRLEKIREEWKNKQLKAKEKAKVAAEARWHKDAPSNPQALLTICPSPSPSPSETPKKTNTPQGGFDLPVWINSEIWETYLEVRKSKRAATTPRAWNMVIKQLEYFRSAGYNPNAILETSIRSNWIDVYEPQKNNSGGKINGKTDRAYATASNLIQEIEDHHGVDTGELLPGSGTD